MLVYIVSKIPIILSGIVVINSAWGVCRAKADCDELRFLKHMRNVLIGIIGFIISTALQFALPPQEEVAKQIALEQELQAKEAVRYEIMADEINKGKALSEYSDEDIAFYAEYKNKKEDEANKRSTSHDIWYFAWFASLANCLNR